jgi:hypothetical protein
MLKSQIKMLETLEALIEEYSAFQRSRPDLPQGSLCDWRAGWWRLGCLMSRNAISKVAERSGPAARSR